MDWIPVIVTLSVFVGVMAPIFWLINHFRDPIPIPPIEESTEPKTELEEIFGV